MQTTASQQKRPHLVRFRNIPLLFSHRVGPVSAQCPYYRVIGHTLFESQQSADNQAADKSSGRINLTSVNYSIISTARGIGTVQLVPDRISSCSSVFVYKCGIRRENTQHVASAWNSMFHFNLEMLLLCVSCCWSYPEDRQPTASAAT